MRKKTHNNLYWQLALLMLSCIWLIFVFSEKANAIIIKDKCSGSCPIELSDGRKEVWCGTCTGQKQTCDWHSGVVVTYNCQDNAWIYQYPECSFECFWDKAPILPISAEGNCYDINIASYVDNPLNDFVGNIYSDEPGNKFRIKFKVKEENRDDPFRIYIDDKKIGAFSPYEKTNKEGVIEKIIENNNENDFFFQPGPHAIVVKKPDQILNTINTIEHTYCTFQYSVHTKRPNLKNDVERNNAFSQCTINAKINPPVPGIDETDPFVEDFNIQISVYNIPYDISLNDQGNLTNVNYKIVVEDEEGNKRNYYPTSFLASPDSYNFTNLVIFPESTFKKDQLYKLNLKVSDPSKEYETGCKGEFSINDDGDVDLQTESPEKVDEKVIPANLKKLEDICEENILRPEDKNLKDFDINTINNLPDEDQKKRLTENLNCKNCVTGAGEDGPGAWTAIGCLPTNIPAFFKYFFKIGLGLAGGIGFLLIVWGAFTILISGGNPEQINKGREIIISAIAGLLLIIFSVLVLRIIGVDIFKIPGFESK